MKKRFWALLLCCVCLVSLLALPLSAATTDIINLISYRWLMYQFPEADISQPSPGIIRLYFPFSSAGATVTSRFYLSQLFSYDSVSGYAPGVYSFLNLSLTIYNGDPANGGDPMDTLIDLTGNTALNQYYISYTLDSTQSLYMEFPVICAGEVGEAEVSTPSTWPVLHQSDLIPVGYLKPGDLSYNDGYVAGKTEGYEQGYNEGFQAGKLESNQDYRTGYEEGYTKGYTNGLEEVAGAVDSLYVDYWKNASYELYYSFSGVSYSNHTFEPTIVNNGVDIPYTEILLDALKDTAQDYTVVDMAYIQIDFEKEAYLPYDQIALFIGGNYPIVSCSFVTSAGSSYAGSTLITTSGDRLNISGVYPRGLLIKSLVLTLASWSVNTDVRSLNVYSDDLVYNYGYQAGYNQAVKDEGGIYVDAAYGQGFSEGYDIGFADGNVVSQRGNFASLVYSVVEAPFNTFRSLFNFEILGVNLLGFIGSVLTLVVLLWIVKKVLL